MQLKVLRIIVIILGHERESTKNNSKIVNGNMRVRNI